LIPPSGWSDALPVEKIALESDQYHRFLCTNSIEHAVETNIAGIVAVGEDEITRRPSAPLRPFRLSATASTGGRF
jgi:hypothetical protein